MKILFLGQTSLTERIEALGCELAAGGHDVVAASAFKSEAGSRQGVRVRYWPSLNPEQPGGWAYHLLCLLTLWRAQPQVAHIHGWRAALLASLMIMLSPETMYVYTVDSAKTPTWVVRMAARLFDAVTAPTRELQMWLLHACGVRAQYVPDGYRPVAAPLLEVKRWGLTNNKYVLLVGATPAEARAAGKRAVRLQKLATTERAQRSLMAGAKTIILGSRATAQQALWAMAAGKAIVSAAVGSLPEILGASARFARVSRAKELAGAIGKRGAGARAKRRAQAHFTWERVARDYLMIYNHFVATPVPMDSARRPIFTQPMVQ